MTSVTVKKPEIEALYERMFKDDWKKLNYHAKRTKVLNFIRNNRPKHISLERWENIGYTARYELYLKEQKKDLLKKQQELFDKLKAEFNSAV